MTRVFTLVLLTAVAMPVAAQAGSIAGLVTKPPVMSTGATARHIHFYGPVLPAGPADTSSDRPAPQAPGQEPTDPGSGTIVPPEATDVPVSGDGSNPFKP